MAVDAPEHQPLTVEEHQAVFQLKPAKADVIGDHLTDPAVRSSQCQRHPVQLRVVMVPGTDMFKAEGLNGCFVGYAEDSFTPSDFDLTPYIRETGNRLCVEVYKRSSAAWIEDQDFFRFSGIFRTVFLFLWNKMLC